ncbi:MAG: D-alanyl-D-alanine carboxypeptidase family protein [Acidimicrobiales bacterium]
MNHALASKLWRVAISLLGISAVVVGLIAGAGPATASSGTTTSVSTTTSTTLPGATTTTEISAPTTTVTGPRPTLAWPAQGSAAIMVPQLSVSAASPNQPRQPIASLTKLMTAWVVLHRLPLSVGETGPCETVDASDMELYEYDNATDQSGVPIRLGERLCESTLLRGMLVHSAGDYAQLLAALTGMQQATFVADMNLTALSLGLRQTHYVDVTGISAGDTSTARNQVVVASDLMTKESIVQSIVKLTQVSLPLAGVVTSFTPFTGQGNVIGVKSGYTSEAGGCDAMAMLDVIDGAPYTTYAVVLGEHSDNPLGTAGNDALALSHSIRASMARIATPTGPQVRWIGSPSDVDTTTTTTTSTTTTSTTTTSTTSATSTTTTTLIP